jgi:hypothetical protein
MSEDFRAKVRWAMNGLETERRNGTITEANYQSQVRQINHTVAEVMESKRQVEMIQASTARTMAIANGLVEQNDRVSDWIASRNQQRAAAASPLYQPAYNSNSGYTNMVAQRTDDSWNRMVDDVNYMDPNCVYSHTTGPWMGWR